MHHTVTRISSLLVVLASVVACGPETASDGSVGGENRGSEGGEEQQATVEGVVGGAGIRGDEMNLYLNQDGSVDNHLGTRDGEFSLFTAECSEEEVLVSAGDGVSARFTVGSQEVVFLLDGEEFATVFGEDGDEVEWGAGSSFSVEMLQEFVRDDGRDDRVTFSGSVDCP